MTTSPPPAGPAPACECEEEMRPACGGEVLPRGARHFCLFHCPGREKSTPFREALARRLDQGDFNFAGVSFPDEVTFLDFRPSAPATFRKAVFHGRANFEGARFGRGVDFREAQFFGEARFHKASFGGGANFYKARFYSRANFIGADFGPRAKADFSYARFYGDADFTTTFCAPVSFNYAVFGAEGYFRSAVFRADANFRSATFKTHARFGGGGRFDLESYLNLQFTRVEKPEHIFFDQLTLLPHWFINVDVRRFDFTNVRWAGRLDSEIAWVKHRRKEIVGQPHRLMARTYRQLAVNAEEHHRYKEASEFRYCSMDAARLRKGSVYSFWTLDWWYWFASGYGERFRRAFLVLIALWMAFALVYWGARCTPPSLFREQVCVAWEKKQEVESPQGSLKGAVGYTFSVMTLQRPDPRPASAAAHVLVGLATILGPLQAALLALAIRRRFMR